VINIHFKEYKNDAYQIIAIFAKQARGMMTNYAIKNRITDPEDLRSFNVEGYEYSAPMSSATDWVFIR
jgi:cytoplasmic iron level regulating protein YaaA (DUF328/UPF0246 family)